MITPEQSSPVEPHRSRSGHRGGGLLGRRRARGLISLAAVVPLVAGCVLVSGRADELRRPDDPPPAITMADVAREHITASAIDRNVEFLASVKARARNGSRPASDRTAAWIASQFHLAGLSPAGEDGGFVRYRANPGHESNHALVPDVVATVPGSDPDLAGQPIVVLARFGSDPNGAVGEAGLDEAPACAIAALIEVARAVAGSAAGLRRPIMFVAVHGSGSGVPVDEAVAVIGIGEIGSVGATTIEVDGYDRSSIGPLLARLAAEMPGLGLDVVPGGRAAGRTFLLAAHGPPHGPAPDPAPGLAPSPAPGVDRDGAADIAVVGLTTRRGAASGGRSETPGVDVEIATAAARLIFLAAHWLAGEATAPGR